MCSSDLATALLAVAQVQAVEVATEIESNNYGGYNSYGHGAIATITKSYNPVYRYNGHGHHSYSSHSSSSYSSFSSSDYSSSDFGFGYRSVAGVHKHYRYAPVYNHGRYYYGKKYASYSGVYKAAYRGYGVRSYSACLGCARPSYYGNW